MGYGLVHTIEEVILLCRQAAQHIHTVQTIGGTADLLDFAKVRSEILLRICPSYPCSLPNSFILTHLGEVTAN